MDIGEAVKGAVMDAQGNRPVESSAWIERMIWRTVFLIVFLIGLIGFVVSGMELRFLALVVGGLGPGLFLMAREQHERMIEAQRRAHTPEDRHDTLPPLRPQPGHVPPHVPYDDPAVTPPTASRYPPADDAAGGDTWR